MWCWLAARREPALALLAAGLIGANPAAAAVPQVRFQVPGQSLTEALLSMASQAGVSVSARELGRCAAASRPVYGRMSIAKALERVLKGSGCSYRMIDPATYVVEPARPASPARQTTEAIVAPPAPAGPDEASALPANLLDNLVVSTARRDALVGRTPYAVSTLSGADLARIGAADAPGLAAQFGGLSATNLGAGRDKLFVRGLSDGVFTGRTQSTVGLYLDDVPITYTAPNPDLMLADVDHVELLRGPQGTLYGVGSIGGVLRVVTNRPDDRAAHAAVSLTGSLTQDGAPSATATAMINLPVVADRAAVRVVAYTERLGGYLDNPGLGLHDTNHIRRQGLRAAATDRISPDWTASVGLVLQSLDAGDSQYVDAGAGRMRSTAILEPHDNDFRQGSLGLEGRGGWGGLKLSAGYVLHDFDTRYDASRAVARFGAGPETAAYDDRNHVEFLVGEAVFTSPEQRRLQWLAGLFAARAEQGSTLTLAPPSGPALYAETRKDALHEWALFGEASYQLTPALKLTAGARVFQADLRTRSSGPGPFAGQLERTDIAPKLVLSWQPRGSVLFYAQASEGYRLGGFNTSGMAGQVFGSAGEAQPSRAYRPDELYNYEVGAKLALFKQRLHVQAAVFNAVWRDLQTDQFMASGLPFTANVGQAIDRGVEVETDWRASRRLDLKANLLLNQPEVSHRDPTYGGRADAGLPGVPRVSLGASANYRRPVGAGLVLSAMAQVEFVGHSRLGFDSASGAAMGDYLTNRVSLGIEKRRWKLYAFIDNAADARADTFAFGNPFTYRQTTQATPMRPRTVGLTLSASY